MCDPLLETSPCFGIFVENFKQFSSNKVFFDILLFLEYKFYVEYLILAIEIFSKLR